MTSMPFTLYRRHVQDCPHKSRKHTNCQCPVHAEGTYKGKRLRASLGTNNWGIAGRRLVDIESELSSGVIHKPIQEAVDAYLEHLAIEQSTRYKYTRLCNLLARYCEDLGIAFIGGVTLEVLDHFKSSRKLVPLTWSKELQIYRSLFAFCQARHWCSENPARAMKMPPEPKPKPRHPYTNDEIKAIIDACDRFGSRQYEKLRARAMVLLMRFYGLRISDVATLRRDRVQDGEIMLHAMKNGESLWLPLYPEVSEALERVPQPRTGDGSEYFFWHGRGDPAQYVRTVERTLGAMFRESGVKGAVAHRFRHTLTTEILVSGGSIEDAANILGDNPETIRRHYAKLSREYQARTTLLMEKVHGRVERRPVASEVIPMPKKAKTA
jgi:integrase